MNDLMIHTFPVSVLSPISSLLPLSFSSLCSSLIVFFLSYPAFSFCSFSSLFHPFSVCHPTPVRKISQSKVSCEGYSWVSSTLWTSNRRLYSHQTHLSSFCYTCIHVEEGSCMWFLDAWTLVYSHTCLFTWSHVHVTYAHTALSLSAHALIFSFTSTTVIHCVLLKCSQVQLGFFGLLFIGLQEIEMQFWKLSYIVLWLPCPP